MQDPAASGAQILLAAALGASLAVPGVALYVLAPRLPRNPLVGLRVSYAMVSRGVWVRANRLAGLLLALAGAAGIPLGIALGPAVQAVYLAAAAVAVAVVGVEYSRRLAEVHSISEPPEPGEGAPEQLHWSATLRASAALLAAPALALGGLAAWRLAANGLPGAASVAAAVAASVAYTAYLAAWRPEAFLLPWLDPRGAGRLALLVVASHSLTVSGAELAMLGPAGPGIALIAIGAAAGIAALWIAIKAYPRARRGVGGAL